jgi:hypothetical protein
MASLMCVGLTFGADTSKPQKPEELYPFLNRPDLRHEGQITAANGQKFIFRQGAWIVYDNAAETLRLRAAADAGHPDAIYELGLSYFYGTGVPVDMDQAVGLFRKAADKNEPDAEYMLGVIYENAFRAMPPGVSNPIPMNLKEAARWYRAAARDGNRRAQDRLDAVQARRFGNLKWIIALICLMLGVLVIHKGISYTSSVNREMVWRTLFLVLATINLTVLTTSYLDYSSIFIPLNKSLAEEFDAALQENSPSPYMRNFGRDGDMISQLNDLHPPFWKAARHHEYIVLAEDLRLMESQVRQSAVSYSTDTWKTSYSHMPNVKQADIDRMMKTMQETQQRQMAMRDQMIPKYKEKLEQLKALGRSLS